MGENRKPPEERTAEDYRAAAEDSLELAKILAGQGGIGDRDVLERMAPATTSWTTTARRAACVTT